MTDLTEDIKRLRQIADDDRNQSDQAAIHRVCDRLEGELQDQDDAFLDADLERANNVIARANGAL